ncbi:transporter substrate-binding domain-containing protein [Motilimonas cestriensis]|uniref:Transporter substrate-binding domain-containing protein n=1 Tax=Motilimonas cestriensis TaxID=2742685 RepID=A0ABS8W5A9_9GAMM|nr:transporter substrate-binding domain-containing protein [Motilimonas cestriensis]MCE2593695.1 transporter substrate-binding domain-containing protein [Motilimonas cestriensis]
MPPQKKSIRTIFIALLGLVLPYIAFAAPAEKPLRIVTLQDFKPFIWCKEHHAKGIDIEIVSELFRRVEYPFTIECIPWKRALIYLRRGNADALFSAYKTLEREAFATYLAYPLHTSAFSIFTHQSNTNNYNQISDLYGKRIGISSGYSVNPEFDQAKAEQRFVISETKSTESGIRMLLMDRIDFYINGKIVVLNKAKEMGVADQLVGMSKPMHEPKPAYLIISKAAKIPNKERLINKLNQALEQMWQDGTIQTIIDSYTQPNQAP